MTYTIRCLGPVATARDIDGKEIRLRVSADGEYFQFFRAIASGPALAVLQPAPGEDFWNAFLGLACRSIEEEIRAGFRPLSDPMTAAIIRPDVDEAQRVSRSGRVSRPECPREETWNGVVVHTFT
jgi:hypothetical protein